MQLNSASLCRDHSVQPSANHFGLFYDYANEASSFAVKLQISGWITAKKCWSRWQFMVLIEA